MSKVTLVNITSGYQTATQQNANNDAVEAAIENTLSRDGTEPNQMNDAIDMNGNPIHNLGSPTSANDAARFIDVTESVDIVGLNAPAQSGNQGKALTTDGASTAWGNAWFNLTPAESIAGVTPVTFAYPPGYCERYGIVGDNTTDDTQALKDAFAQAGQTFGAPVVIPKGIFRITSTLGKIPNNVHIRGAGKNATRINKLFNGDLGTLGDYVTMEDIFWMGNADLGYTGRGFLCEGADGRQGMTRCRMYKFDSYCIEFEYAAGSQSHFTDCTFSRWNADGLNRWAIKISDTQQLLAVPRKFENCESDGQDFIDFGGCNNVFLTNCYFGHVRFTADSRAVCIMGGRCRSPPTVTYDGANNTWMGCDVFPSIILNTTLSNSIYGPNTGSTSVTDNATFKTNHIYTRSVAFTPTWTGTGTNPVIGNGALRGQYSRFGDAVFATYEVIMGSTTTFGTGNWTFALPVGGANPNESGITVTGSAQLTDTGTTIELGCPVVANGATTFTIQTRGLSPAVSVVTNAIPWTWASGDILRISLTYLL